MKKIAAVLLALLLAVESALPVEARMIGSVPLFSYMVQQEEGAASFNLQNFYCNEYGQLNLYHNMQGLPVYSYLADNGEDGYTRIEAIEKESRVVVETYTRDFTYVSSKALEMELPLFGGCFVGQDYCFLVFGKSNMEELHEAEVLRIVKYDKEWNRLGAQSIYGANTQYPFHAGSLRMTEAGGTLYIHTCHQMFQAADGLNHQANMTFALDEETLEVVEDQYGVSYIGRGYVSHSFNQFVVSDGTSLYRLDHGDAYPRAVVVTKSPLSKITSCQNTEILPISIGEVGDNVTGVSVGGFALAGGRLVSAGNSINFNEADAALTDVRNVYVTSTDTDLSATKMTWLTDYDADSAITVGYPKLVKASEDTLYVLWEELDIQSKRICFRIAEVSSAGEVIMEKTEPVYGRLSDCEPVYTAEGNLVWYSTDYDTPVFYSLDTKQLGNYRFSILDLAECDVSLEREECENTGVDYRNKVPVTVKYGDEILIEGLDYTVEYSDLTHVGEVQVTVGGIRYFSGTVATSYMIKPPAPTSFYRYSRTTDSATFRWDARYADGYQMEQKKEGIWEQIAETTEKQYEVTGLSPGTEYEFRVRSYQDVGDKRYYSDYTEALVCLTLPASPKLQTAVGSDSVTLSWEPVKGADYYEINWHVYGQDTDTDTVLQTVETSYVVDGLEPSSRHVFSVKAYGEGGKCCSKASDTRVVAIPAEAEHYDLSTATIQLLDGGSYPYEPGKAAEPRVLVSYNGGFLSGMYYEVSYSDNMEVGTGKVVVTGIGDCTGTIEQTFEILPRTVEVTETATADSVRLAWNELPEATGYAVYVRYPGEDWKQAGTVTQTEYEQRGLSANTSYTFMVCAITRKDNRVYEGEGFVCYVTTQKVSVSAADTENPSGSGNVANPPGNGTGTETGGSSSAGPDESADETKRLTEDAVTLSKTSYVYNGKVQTPSVTVRNRAGEILSAGKDYKVSYSKGRKEAGIYSVTVTGIAPYGGTVTKQYTISPKAVSLTGKGKLRSKDMTVKWKKASGKIDGYEIQYSPKSSFKKDVTTVTAKKGASSKKIKLVNAKRRYYVRIRAYRTVKDNGGKIKLYSGWSKKKMLRR